MDSVSALPEFRPPCPSTDYKESRWEYGRLRQRRHLKKSYGSGGGEGLAWMDTVLMILPASEYRNWDKLDSNANST